MDEGTSTLRATGHPVRLRILSLLTGAELSATEVARELDLTHANASYHLRVLAKAGLIVEAGQERIRGGVAKRYRHPWRHEVRDAAPQDGQTFARAAAGELIRRSAYAAGGWPGYGADAELWVEPAVWERVRDLLAEAGALLHDSARSPRTEGSLRVNLTAFAFVMDDDAAGRP